MTGGGALTGAIAAPRSHRNYACTEIFARRAALNAREAAFRLARQNPPITTPSRDFDLHRRAGR
jgi:hypothetical protein